MDSTCINLTPEQKTRLVTPHNRVGEVTPAWDLPTLAGAGGLRSTANDLLKYVSANLGLTRSPLTPVMAKTHQTPLIWNVQRDRRKVNLVWHGGGTGGCRSMVMLDKHRRRGVVMLTNSVGSIDAEAVCRLLIGCDWRSDAAIEWPPVPPAPVERIISVKLDSKQLDAIVGRYVFLPDAISPNGFHLTIWREGDQLMGQTRGEKVVQGAFELFPESATTFFLTINHARLVFDKSDNEEIIAVTHRLEGYPDIPGKREP
jgi:D-alanyl-D-alanine-carboxypeptidase/D-alanyl-D-alanine-endopeptidase